MTESRKNPAPLLSCPACGCRDLFIRKDFPQKLGLLIVILAALAFLILAASRGNFYLGAAVLMVAGMIDAVLYMIVPEITVCYPCRAEVRHGPLKPEHHGLLLAGAAKN